MSTYTNTDSNLPDNNNQVFQPLSAKQKASKLVSFSVTSDSMVATANLVVDQSHQIIKIWWGDEQENQQPQTIDLRKERRFVAEISDANTLKLQHAYALGMLRKIILVQTKDQDGKISWDNAVIDLEPRYQFIVYPIKLEINEHLDSIFEKESELKINMKIFNRDESFLDEQWNANFQSSFGIGTGTIYPLFYTLEGSRFHIEIEYHDDPINIALTMEEIDGIAKDILEAIWENHPIRLIAEWKLPVEFDGSNAPVLGFHPRTHLGYNEYKIQYSVDDGVVYVIFRTEINLIVPLENHGLVMTKT